jgi:hypothetical protein
MAVPKPRIRWFYLTPGRLPAALMAVERLLCLAEWFRWFPKGYAVLIAMAGVEGPAACFGSVGNPIRQMEREHESAGLENNILFSKAIAMESST